jgi:predicted outer membrane lipoprotein
MTELLIIGLAIAVLVIPLACAYAIVVRLARRRTRSH